MKPTSHTLLLGMALGLFSACSSTSLKAPVIERNPAPVEVRSAPEPVVPEKTGDARLYTVKRGDTLLRLALDNGLNYRDIVAWNNLSNPDDIKVDQVLRLSPPERSSTVQTAPISMPPPSTKPAVASVPKKSGPSGDKRPYTEANLAELQKADGAPAGNGNGAGSGSSAAAGNSAPSINPAPAIAAAPLAGVATPSVPSAPAGAVSDDERLSWMWPSNGRVIAGFDEGKNKGIDIAGKAGQQVLAAGAGKVMYAGSGIRGYGNLVIVKHSSSLLSAYAHNRSIVVKEGDSVNKGQIIAEMGDSDADSVKLHFEIRQQGKPVDPSKFLPVR
jgi:lipoprotein NlpD